eukprot:scaffold80407_cov63-Phaeocystis_antarctica.AAC.1
MHRCSSCSCCSGATGPSSSQAACRLATTSCYLLLRRTRRASTYRVLRTAYCVLLTIHLLLPAGDGRWLVTTACYLLLLTNHAVDEGYDAHAVVPTLSGASSLQLAAFFEEERLHVKEGVVVIDEDYSSRKTASISTEGCDAIVHGFEARLDSCRLSLDSCRETNGKPGGADGGAGAGAGGGGAGGGGAARARQERQAKAAKAARAKLEKLRLKLSGTTLLQAIDAAADPDATAADNTADQAAVPVPPPAAPEVPEAPEAAVAAVAVSNGGDAGGSPTEAAEEAEEAEELVEAAAATHAATTAAAVASAAEEEGEG